MKNTNEEWRLIPWSNGLYYASNLGRIKRIESVVRNQPEGKENVGHRKVGGNILSQKTKKNGYMEVNMYIAPQKSKMCHVHRGVYFSFNPNADQSMHINHIDFNRSNNNIENLELVTCSENMRHSSMAGRSKRKVVRLGESATNSKLSNEDVLKIRELHKQTRAISNISKMFGIGKTQVQRIVKRQSWTHI